MRNLIYHNQITLQVTLSHIVSPRVSVHAFQFLIKLIYINCTPRGALWFLLFTDHKLTRVMRLRLTHKNNSVCSLNTLYAFLNYGFNLVRTMQSDTHRDIRTYSQTANLLPIKYSVNCNNPLVTFMNRGYLTQPEQSHRTNTKTYTILRECSHKSQLTALG